MKKILISLLLVGFGTHMPALSQPPSQKEMQTQMMEAINEMNKQIADLEKQIADAKKNKLEPESIKELEQQLAMMKKQAAMMGGLNKNISKLPVSTKEKPSPFEDPEKKRRFPEKKTALLASLPDGVINKQQLINFLNVIHIELKKKLPPETVKRAESNILKMKGDLQAMALGGAMAWYANAPSDALLLLTYAAPKTPDDNTLNNCAAVFNLCGLEDKAIPVLKYVLAHDPNNSTVLNNLGQAYAGLGDLNTSMNYLRAAMVHSPSHPEACATAAYIEAERGNTAEAVKLMSEAVKTGYTDARVKFLEDQQPGRTDPWFNMGDIDLKNDFYMTGDFDLPPQCRSWTTSETTFEAQEAFRKKLEEMERHYTNLVIQNSNVQITGKVCPWNEAIYFKMKQISDDYDYRRQKDGEMLFKQSQTIIEQAQQDRIALDARYDPQYKACEGVGGNCATNVAFRHCKDRTSLEDQWHSQLADVADAFKHNWYAADLEYHNKIVWLMSLRSTDDKFLKAEAATQTISLLHKLKAYTLSTCNPAGKPNCWQFDPANPANQSPAKLLNVNCPINIIVPAGPLKMNLNCGQFKVDVQAGVIVLTYEKDFVSKESTIAVGPGASIGGPLVELGVKAQAYVKFDGNNQPIDMGVSGEVELEIAGPVSPIVKSGFTAGVNSGINPQGQLKSVVNLSTFTW